MNTATSRIRTATALHRREVGLSDFALALTVLPLIRLVRISCSCRGEAALAIGSKHACFQTFVWDFFYQRRGLLPDCIARSGVNATGSRARPAAFNRLGQIDKHGHDHRVKLQEVVA
jgi:hypothetical protein